MKKLVFFILISLAVGACTSGRKALDQGSYRDAIAKAVNRLSQSPNNRKARQVVEEGYPMAMRFYQEEIDQALSGNDPFKWNKTLGIMQEVNHVSDLIRRIPASRKIIANPKVYTSELQTATEHAAEEHYLAGLNSMERQSKEDAKEACRHFYACDQLIPGYKDVLSLLVESKDLATTRVIVEPLPAPTVRYELTADFFYTQVMQRMSEIYPDQSFVNFYTPEQAEASNLQYPDMVVRMAFMDFYMERPRHYEEQVNLSRDITEEVEVKVSRDSVRTEQRVFNVKGRMKVLTDELASGGLLNLQIEDFQSNKSMLNNNIPGEFLWQNQYGVFIGDERVLTKKETRILNNQAVPPPGPQDMFLEFTKPIFSQLTDQLNSFFRRYN